jgi:transcription elongation factor Elf1
MVQAISLMDVQLSLPRMFCPACYRTELEAVLHCEVDRRDCVPTVHCLHCGYTFEPESFRRTVASIEGHLADGRIELPCTSCGHRYAVVELRCDLADRECSYVATCRACGTTRRLSL